MTKVFFGVRIIAIGLVCLLPLLGCSRRVTTDDVITGSVKYQNRPVPAGQVVFYAGGHIIAVGPLGRDGTYNVCGLVDADYQVAVVTNADLEVPKPGNGQVPLTRPHVPKDAPVPGQDPPSVTGRASSPPPLTPPDLQRESSGVPPDAVSLPGGPGKSVVSKGGPKTLVSMGGEVKSQPKKHTSRPAFTQEEQRILDAVQKQYGDPEKSGLTFSKGNGKTFNLDLK
jgi:hypothetical protein